MLNKHMRKNQLTTDEEAMQECQVDLVSTGTLPGTCVYLILEPDLGCIVYIWPL